MPSKCALKTAIEAIAFYLYLYLSIRYGRLDLLPYFVLHTAFSIIASLALRSCLLWGRYLTQLPLPRHRALQSDDSNLTEMGYFF